MTDIKKAVADVRKNRQGGRPLNTPASFVSGDVAEGTIREQEPTPPDPPKDPSGR